jgi:hypothetical protein
VVALTIAGTLLALWFFTARDQPTTSAPSQEAPGRAFTGASPYDADLQRGNVVMVVPRDQVDAAHKLALELAGPGDPALRAAGQAVLVRGAPGAGVAAYAKGRMLRAGRTSDPALREFVEYWLGRVAG